MNPARRPANTRAAHLKDLLAACPHLTVLVEQVRAFADLLPTGAAPISEDAGSLAVQDSDLPALQPSWVGYVRHSTLTSWPG